jgi:hypothetical protein
MNEDLYNKTYKERAIEHRVNQAFNTIYLSKVLLKGYIKYSNPRRIMS